MQTLAPPAARAVVPRLAATTLLLRDSPRGPEVLMVKRSTMASFMPGAYVFPGGAVDAADAEAPGPETNETLAKRIGAVTRVGHLARAYAMAAVRECAEECGVDLGGTAGLHPWSRWVTPLGLPKRFDTLFFVCRAPTGQVARSDGQETTTLEWAAPRESLQSHAAGTFPMEFATVSTLRSLLPFVDRDVQSLLAHAATLRDLPPIHPRLKIDATGRIAAIVMPGEPDYSELDGDEA
jgi:8-oxo-dGTP pyrophosphatase MutT (NUDIX family)